MCGDGTLQLIQLDEQGNLATKSHSEKFFDPNKDPLTEKASRVGDTWLFFSFDGIVHPVKFAGSKVEIGKPWSLFNDKERADKWKLGGSQFNAVHAGLARLYVIVHQGGPFGHKDPGKDVWVYDLATHKGVAQFKLHDCGDEYRRHEGRGAAADLRFGSEARHRRLRRTQWRGAAHDRGTAVLAELHPEPMSIDPVIPLIARLGLGWLFLAAAVHKLNDIGDFRVVLATYRVLPEALVGVAAWGIVGVEIAVGIGALLQRVDGACRGGGAVARLRRRNGTQPRAGRRDIDCGCGSSAQPLSLGLVARNAMLALGAAIALLPRVARPLHWFDFVSVIAATLVLGLLYAATNQLLAARARLEEWV